MALRSWPPIVTPGRDASANSTCAIVDGMKLRKPAIRKATANRAVSAAPRMMSTSTGTILVGTIPSTVAR